MFYSACIRIKTYCITNYGYCRLSALCYLGNGIMEYWKVDSSGLMKRVSLWRRSEIER